jgi:hypothetical protein
VQYKSSHATVIALLGAIGLILFQILSLHAANERNEEICSTLENEIEMFVRLAIINRLTMYQNPNLAAAINETGQIAIAHDRLMRSSGRRADAYREYQCIFQ